MIDNYYLYKNLPRIDLHGCDRYTATFQTEEFINDCYKLNKKLILIVHGKGEYILKEEIHKMLKKNKLVIAYKLDIYNDGATVVELK